MYDGEHGSGAVLGLFRGSQPLRQRELNSSSNHMLVIFESKATDSYTGFNASYSFFERRGKGNFCFVVLFESKESKPWLARFLPNAMPRIWLITLGVKCICQYASCSFYSSVLKLVIHFFFSSELLTPPSTISTAKQRPDVISSTYTEIAIAVPSSGLVIVALLLVGVSLYCRRWIDLASRTYIRDNVIVKPQAAFAWG